MKKIFVIGIGAGNPEYITVQAIKALNQVDVFFVMNKGESKEELTRLRRDICERYIEEHAYRFVEAADPIRDQSIGDYKSRVEHWHRERVRIYENLIQNELGENQCGAILVWGDPSLYDSTLRIIDQIVTGARVAFDYEVIPGITSLQALTARHKIPLHGIGESILITTGRRLAEGLSKESDNIAVMLDGQAAFTSVSEEDIEIFWGAYLGMENEILLSGKLADIASQIEAVRSEAQKQHGWIMDLYLLRRQAAEE
jgi:precorrin-6A synthase